MSCRSVAVPVTRAVLLALAVAACSTGTNPHHVVIDAGSGSTVGRSCSVDAECSPLRCDPVRLQCICLSDSDCPGQFCDNFTGLCVASVPGCTQDSECPTGQFCNSATRACEALKSFCETCNPLAVPTDPACGVGNSCHADTSLNASFCTLACTGDANCPQGATCQDINMNGMPQCWPAPGKNCKTFLGCTPDLDITCMSAADCQVDGGFGGQICDTSSGLCIAAEQVCPLGTTCDPQSRVCVGSCTADADCVPPDQCVDNICQLVPGCQTDTNCPDNKVCDIAANAAEGQCVPFCTADSDCPSGSICLPTVEPDGSTREKCEPLCYDSAQCPLNEACVDSSGNLFHGTPDGGQYGTCSTAMTSSGNPGVSCQFSDACPTCQFCGAGDVCQSAAGYGYCEPCDPNVTDDCHINHGLPEGSACLSLAGLDGNGNIISTGPFFCGVVCEGTTTVLPSVDSAPCPAGFDCVALTSSGYNCVPANYDCTMSEAGGPICPDAGP